MFKYGYGFILIILNCSNYYRMFLEKPAAIHP